MKSFISEPLGLYGYKELDPVFLAALASERPLLLIGRHGTGKSYFLENLSKALNKDFRYYNASLLNYDDLVGIPYPDEEKKSLHYIYEESAIWEAETVFFDEINRTSPELQNKLFPIINEKMMQGKKLSKLIYRFAAMNPPYMDEDLGKGYGEAKLYEGTNHLDIALADRFAYLVVIPDYDSLTYDDKISVLDIGKKSDFLVPLDELIEKTKKRFPEVSNKMKGRNLKLFFKALELVKGSYGYLSPRRMKILYESFYYIEASLSVLSELDDGYFSENPIKSLTLTLENCLPYVTNIPLNKTKISALVKEANRQTEEEEKGLSDKVFSIPDYEERLIYALRNKDDVAPEVFGKLFPDAIARVDAKKARAIAIFAYLVLRNKEGMKAVDMETIVHKARPALEPKVIEYSIYEGEINFGEVIKRIEKTYDGNLSSIHKGLLISFLQDEDGYKNVEEVEELSKTFSNLERRIYGQE